MDLVLVYAFFLFVVPLALFLWAAIATHPVAAIKRLAVAYMSFAFLLLAAPMLNFECSGEYIEGQFIRSAACTIVGGTGTAPSAETLLALLIVGAVVGFFAWLISQSK